MAMIKWFQNVLSGVKDGLRLRRVRRCSQPVQQEVIAEEIKPEPIKHKLMRIEIVFRDGTSISFTQKNKEDSTRSYFACYYQFCNWFYNRLDSQWFTFKHTDGENIFKREDVKRINFSQKIEAENIA
jgi:hypothetical protein